MTDVPAETVRRTGWWRRNLVALCALVLLIPASVVVIAGNEWADYYLYRSTLPVDAQDDGTIDLGNAVWGPVRSAEITDVSAFTVPADVKVIAVAVPVDPHDELPTCMSPMLVEQSTGRQWSEARSELGIPYSAEENATCRPAEDDESPSLEPYELIVAFGVPDDAEGPFWVEVSPAEAMPRLARFSIDP